MVYVEGHTYIRVPREQHSKVLQRLTGSAMGSSVIGSEDVIANVNVALSAQLNWERL